MRPERLTTLYRTEMRATPTVAWNPQWSRRWPNTSTPSMSLDGSRPQQRLPRMSPVRIWLITPT